MSRQSVMKRRSMPLPVTAALVAMATALASCAGVYAQNADPAPSPNSAATSYSEADEALYMQRMSRLSEGGSGGAGLSFYDTLEPVRGASEPYVLKAAVSSSFSPEALEQAKAYAAASNSSALMILKDGRLELEAYFGEFDRDTPIVSKSLAKPVTALLIGRALMLGHIKSLDQPVADFITEWKGDPQRERILVRHLLDMRTGLLPQAFASKPEDILNRAYLHPRHDEIIINEYPLTDEPGTRYEYSNANAELVAPLLERATGMRYGEFLSRELLDPLGAPGGSIWVNRPGGTAHSGCCLLLPAQSFAQMALLVLNDGIWNGKRLLPEGYVAEMRTPTAENSYYGLGLWLAGKYIERRGYAHPDVPYGKVLHSQPYADKDLVLFDGNSNQVVYIVPSQNLIILRTGARPPEGAEWDNSFLPNLLIRDAVRQAGSKMPQEQPR